jgi:hypothetical protein
MRSAKDAESERARKAMRCHSHYSTILTNEPFHINILDDIGYQMDINLCDDQLILSDRLSDELFASCVFGTHW